MSRTTSSKNLPLIISIIKQQRLEGLLIAYLEENRTVQLFFRQGELIHLNGDQHEQAADELLHALFGQTDFGLEWQPLQVRLANPNLTAEMRSAFLDVLQVLTDNGNFFPLDQSQLDQSFFNSQATTVPPTGRNAPLTPSAPLVFELGEIAPIQIDLAQPQPQSLPLAQTPTTSSSAPQLKSVETNVLLPPGQHQDQLEVLLGEVSLKEQLEALRRAHFTGYVYYRLDQTGPDAALGDCGLVLFNSGTITDILYQAGDTGQRQTGSMAYHKLAGLRLVPEIYRVQSRILKAYRAIIACDNPQRNIKVTKANFTNLMTAFKQSRRDGVVILYLDSLKLHYFFLFESGIQVGVFGPESKSGHLVPLASALVLPSVDAQARMSVLIAGKPGIVAPTAQAAVASPPSPGPVQVLPSSTPDFFDPPGVQAPTPEAVDWSGLLADMNQPSSPPRPAQPQPSKWKNDTSNPFDF